MLFQWLGYDCTADMDKMYLDVRCPTKFVHLNQPLAPNGVWMQPHGR